VGNGKITTIHVWMLSDTSDRLHEERSYEYKIDIYVSRWYWYKCEQKMLSHLITPVVIDSLVKDGKIQPPATTNKQQSGQPKKQRILNGSKYESEDSTVVCSLCNLRGHNWLTCLARKEQQKKK
jgi:hypothetical protein